mmetsp:Transcript_24059/g.78313  ORF Transcript_24059/g.78313 Transcript_24059/m.78313 type:complete len:111 (-) Transcript_24059:225-557(-)
MPILRWCAVRRMKEATSAQSGGSCVRQAVAESTSHEPRRSEESRAATNAPQQTVSDKESEAWRATIGNGSIVTNQPTARTAQQNDLWLAAVAEPSDHADEAHSFEQYKAR